MHRRSLFSPKNKRRDSRGKYIHQGFFFKYDANRKTRSERRRCKNALLKEEDPLDYRHRHISRWLGGY